MDIIRGKCGTDCSACTFKDKFGCRGCKAQNGKLFWGECDIYKCAASKDLEHCGQCEKMPCPELTEFIQNGHNPDRLTNLEKWRSEIIDTRCGLHCIGCSYKDPCSCGGCIATNGHPFHGECPVAICCQNKGFLHCGQCPSLPCKLLTEYSCDPEHGDTPQGARIEQCRKWKENNL